MASVGERHRFGGEIYRVGMNYCIDVPADVSAGFGGARHPTVVGEVASIRFRTRLTPRGGGAHRLFLNGDVRAAAGVRLGDRVEAVIWLDDAPPVVRMPDDLAAAMDAVAGARAAFESMTEAQRGGMVSVLAGAKTPATRARYVARILDNVRERMA